MSRALRWINWIKNQHFTKILGAVTSILSGFIAIPGLIPAGHIKYYAATNVVLGVITVKRGFTNTRNARDAS